MLGVLWWTSISSRGEVVILLVTLCLVSCDGQASHPGGSSDPPSNFMLDILWRASIQFRRGRVVIRLVTKCWVSCNGLASHPGGSSNTQSLYAGCPVMDWHPIHWGGVVILVVTLCWMSCDGLAPHPVGGVVILKVTLCWVSCDGLASHPVGGNSDTCSDFMLGVLWGASIPSSGGRPLSIVLVKVAYYATSSARFFPKLCSKLCSFLKIMLLFLKVCFSTKTQNKSKIIYLLLIKRNIFFILSYTLALIKHH